MNSIKIKLSILALLVSISWFIFSFIFDKDLIGGAFHDFKYHEKYFFNFSNSFLNTIHEYGEKNEVRNSPIFYMLFSQLFKIGFSIENLKYFNLVIIFPIVYFFNKCLDLKLSKLDKKSRLFLISCIFLSPTIASLINYPYPLIWALCFFLMSIYFFLKFETLEEEKLLNASLCVFNLSIASYFTPNFAVFIILFFYNFYLKFKFSKKLIFLIIFSFVLSMPAIVFLVWKDFYMFKNNVFEVSIFEKINLSNKIVIISSFVIFFFIPFFQKLNFDTSNIKKKIRDKNFLILILFILSSILFFDYKSGAGGGFFYKLSIIIFKNYSLIFFIFIFSMLFFYFSNFLNRNNVLIFIILILYNLQYSIYYKYFDPLLFFIFLFLIKFKINELKNFNKICRNCFLFYTIFLLMNIFKNNFLKILAV